MFIVGADQHRPEIKKDIDPNYNIGALGTQELKLMAIMRRKEKEMVDDPHLDDGR